LEKEESENGGKSKYRFEWIPADNQSPTVPWGGTGSRNMRGEVRGLSDLRPSLPRGYVYLPHPQGGITQALFMGSKREERVEGGFLICFYPVIYGGNQIFDW